MDPSDATNDPIPVTVCQASQCRLSLMLFLSTSYDMTSATFTHVTQTTHHPAKACSDLIPKTHAPVFFWYLSKTKLHCRQGQLPSCPRDSSCRSINEEPACMRALSNFCRGSAWQCGLACTGFWRKNVQGVTPSWTYKINRWTFRVSDILKHLKPYSGSNSSWPMPVEPARPPAQRGASLCSIPLEEPDLRRYHENHHHHDCRHDSQILYISYYFVICLWPWWLSQKVGLWPFQFKNCSKRFTWKFPCCSSLRD